MTFGNGGELWRQLTAAGFRLDPPRKGGQFWARQNAGLIGKDRNDAAAPLFHSLVPHKGGKDDGGNSIRSAAGG